LYVKIITENYSHSFCHCSQHINPFSTHNNPEILWLVSQLCQYCLVISRWAS